MSSIALSIDLPGAHATAIRAALSSMPRSGWTWLDDEEQGSPASGGAGIRVAARDGKMDRTTGEQRKVGRELIEIAIAVARSEGAAAEEFAVAAEPAGIAAVLHTLASALHSEARARQLEGESSALRARLERQEHALRSAMHEKGLAVLKSLEERRQREIDSSLLAHHDPGTEVWRHGRFRERLAFECSRSARSGEGLGLILADVDNLARINTAHGYTVGDEVLQRIGRSLGALWISDARQRPPVFGREAPDTFAVLLPATTLEELSASAERVRMLVSRLPFGAARASVSVGAALLPPGGKAPEILELALSCVADAFRAGGNICRVGVVGG